MNIEFWLGSEASFKIAQEGLVKAEAQMREDTDFDPTEYGLLANYDGVGVVNISGSLVTNAPAFATYFGVVGYNVIKDTLTMAAQDPDIKQIVMNIDSGGGSASGVDSVGDLIKTISTQHKPVLAYTDSLTASAAYWIASAADKIYSSRLATLGSVGVLAIHQSYDKMLEEAGITTTVVRAGTHKALANPMEPLSAEGKAEIQAKLDILYNEFTTQISKNRNIPLELSDGWANGKTFYGYQAAEIGLSDGVVPTLDEMVGKLSKKGSVAYSKADRTKLDIGEDTVRKKLLDEKTVAMMAAGVDVDEALAQAPDAPEESQATQEQAPTQAPAQEEQAPVQEEQPRAGSFETMTALNDKIIDLSVENKLLKQKVDSMTASHDQLRNIAMEHINFRKIALGGSYTDYSATSDDGLLAIAAETTAKFNKAFPVGGVTEVASTEKRKVDDDFDESAIRAARI